MSVKTRKVIKRIGNLGHYKSVFWTLTLVIGLGIIGIQSIVLYRDLLAARSFVETSAISRADAALEMLESVHTQAMMNRDDVDGNDGAIATLNGTIAQFSKNSKDLSLWVVMGSKVELFQTQLSEETGIEYELELPRDAIDLAALSATKTQYNFSGQTLRQSRPVIYGQGNASVEKCGGCHEQLMSINPGEIMGAYSASIDLTPELLALQASTKSRVISALVLTAALIGMMMILLQVIAIRPLKRLSNSTNSLATGKLNTEIADTARYDEIGTLARSLDLFRAKLIEKSELEENNAYLAKHDGMTGLPNRSSFGERLAEELALAEANGEMLCVVAIDLNRLKEVDDRHGHGAGDALLEALAKRATRRLENGEVIARFGGSEFMALKRYSIAEELDEFIARLENIITQPLKIEDITMLPTGCFGVAVYPSDGLTPKQLIGNADLAMYRAKSQPGTNTKRFEAAMDDIARERRIIASDVGGALSSGQLSLHYQPQNCVKTHEIVGFEALLRWQHPELGSVSPADFIELAEQNGDIVKIGEWVLREACTEAASWDNDLKIAVNLSAVQLSSGDLARTVHEILLQSGLPPRRLELEITETAIVSDPVRAIGLLRMIKALGVSIAIDDFGAGQSSLSTLHAFPFDKVKMDRSFLLEAETRPESRAIIRAIIAIGHSLDVPVLAEGVETEFQLALLHLEGCQEAQGYLFGKPCAVPNFELENNSATPLVGTRPLPKLISSSK